MLLQSSVNCSGSSSSSLEDERSPCFDDLREESSPEIILLADIIIQIKSSQTFLSAESYKTQFDSK